MTNTHQRQGRVTAREYRRKPETVSAIQWTGDNLDEVREWLGDWPSHLHATRNKGLCVHGEGRATYVYSKLTDYLVRDGRGVHRETAEDFERAYEVLPDPRNSDSPTCITDGCEGAPGVAVVVVCDPGYCDGPDGECMGHWYCDTCTATLERGGAEVVHRV